MNREAFEKSAIALGVSRDRLDRYTSGTYKSIRVQTYCDFWQAATAAAIPQGYVLVPEVPTEAMLKAGVNAGTLRMNAPSHIVYAAMLQAAKERT